MRILEGQEQGSAEKIELTLVPTQKVGQIMTSDTDTAVFDFGAQIIEASTQLTIQMLVKTTNRIKLGEDDSVELEDGRFVVESRDGANLKLETFQTQSLGAIKTQVSCELLN
ncbi:MAG: hypothetical protein HRT45_11260 [Bdellovibrionales bacterium]|nr:hypothetical protein [Bdellovibrionales bacterium]